MAPRSRWLFGRILTTLVTVVLILYTALDGIYVHIWFNTENAMLVPLTWIPIAACSVATLEWMRRAEKRERADQQGSKKMEIRDRIVVYLPIAVVGAIVGISAVYTIGMIWYQKILVWIFDGVILLTGFIMSEKIKELQKSL